MNSKASWALYDKARALPTSEPDLLGLPMDRTWREVERYTPEDNSDGHEAILWVQRWPAQFYRLTVEGWDRDLTTGSGSEMGLLLRRIGFDQRAVALRHAARWSASLQEPLRLQYRCGCACGEWYDVPSELSC